MATFSLHALARRYERGSDRSDQAVLADIAALVARHKSPLNDGVNFVCPVVSGKWRGERVQANICGTDQPKRPCLSVRTFVD